MHMIVLDDAAHPNPTNLQADPSGILGVNTFVFQTESHSVITHKSKITLIQIGSHDSDIDVAGAYQVTIRSGAAYEPALLLDSSQYEAYGIPDVFGDDQIAFRCPDGVFVTQHDMIRSLMQVSPGRTVHAQQ